MLFLSNYVGSLSQTPGFGRFEFYDAPDRIYRSLLWLLGFFLGMSLHFASSELKRTLADADI